MQMHVCIMSSLLQQVEESIGLFISGARPAHNGRAGAFAPILLPTPMVQTGRPGFFVLFLLFEHKMVVAQFFVLFIAGWWQTYAASLRLHLHRLQTVAGCYCLRWPQNLYPKLTRALHARLPRSSHQDLGYCECARNQ